MLLLKPLSLQGRQTAQLHIKDGLGLRLRQVQPLHQVIARFLDVRRAANNLDNLVNAVQRQQQPLHDVVPVARPLQLVFRPPPDNFLPVADEQLKATAQGQDLRLSVHQGKHYGVER